MPTVEEHLRRVPPQSLEAEESVLGGILLDNTTLDRVVEWLGPDDFYRGNHQKIFSAIRSRLTVEPAERPALLASWTS